MSQWQYVGTHLGIKTWEHRGYTIKQYNHAYAVYQTGTLIANRLSLSEAVAIVEGQT